MLGNRVQTKFGSEDLSPISLGVNMNLDPGHGLTMAHGSLTLGLVLVNVFPHLPCDGC